MKIELATLGIKRPVRLFGIGKNDSDLLTNLVRIGPHVVITIGTIWIEAGSLKPLVLHGRVIQGQVHHHAHIARVRLRDQLLKIFHGAILGRNTAEIGDVIPAITQRRGIKRGQPQGVNAQPLDVIKLANQARYIAYSVAIGVIKSADHHLIKNGTAIPLRVVFQSPMSRGKLKIHQ